MSEATEASIAVTCEWALEFAGRLHAIGLISVASFLEGAGLVKEGRQFAFVIEGKLYCRVDDLNRGGLRGIGCRCVHIREPDKDRNGRELLRTARPNCRR